LKEKDIDENLFWSVASGEVIGQLEIGDFMVAKRMVRRLDRIKKDHEKAMEKIDAEMKKLSAEEKENIRKIFGRVRSGKHAGVYDLIDNGGQYEAGGDDCREE